MFCCTLELYTEVGKPVGNIMCNYKNVKLGKNTIFDKIPYVQRKKLPQKLNILHG